MLPWEHLAVAYCCCSVLHRAILGRPPDRGVVLAVAVGALLPDLVDKPLAWELGLLPGGRSLGHSLLFVGATTVAAWLGVGRRRAGAFAVGALSHLATDVVYPTVFGRDPVVSFLLYPLTDAPPSDSVGVLVRTREIWTDLAAFLASDRGRLYLAAELTLLGTAAALWLLDGAPGLRPRGPRRRGRGEAPGER